MKKVADKNVGEMNFSLGWTVLTAKSADLLAAVLSGAMAEYWSFYSTSEHRNLPVLLPNEKKVAEKVY